MFNPGSAQKHQLGPCSLRTSTKQGKVAFLSFSHIDILDPVPILNTAVGDSHISDLPVPLSGSNLVAGGTSIAEHAITPPTSRFQSIKTRFDVFVDHAP